MQRLIVSGCRWPAPSDSDPGTRRLTGEAGAQYALRIRNACLVAAGFADAGITAIVTGRSTSLRKSSSGASIACRTLDSGLIPVDLIRKVWWIVC